MSLGVLFRCGFCISLKMSSFCLEQAKQIGKHYVELTASSFLFYKVSLVES